MPSASQVVLFEWKDMRLVQKSYLVGWERLQRINHLYSSLLRHVSWRLVIPDLLWLELISTALPSCISIYTNSVSGAPESTSAEVFDSQPLDVAPLPVGDKLDNAVHNILLYAQDPRRQLERKEIRSIFNDFQIILSKLCLCEAKVMEDIWGCNVETDIMGVRNLMNLAHNLTVVKEWDGMRLCNTIQPIWD